MSLNKFLLFAGLVGVVAPVVYGETHCPGNAASLPLRLVQNTLFVAPVNVNGTGPYDFLVDTGAQINSIDKGLAVELHLTPERSVGVSGVETYSRNAVVSVDLAAAGKRVADSEAVVVTGDQLQIIDRRIRGIVGGTFLEHFDLLIDNKNRLLCLDGSEGLSLAMKGRKIPLANPIVQDKTGVPFSRPLVVSASLSGFGTPQILLLDSGSNSPLLFSERARTRMAPLKTRWALKRTVDGVEQDFVKMPSQDVQIGACVLRGVNFAVPMNTIGGRGPIIQEDGVMPTHAYRRVFISSSKGYAVLDTWD